MCFCQEDIYALELLIVEAPDELLSSDYAPLSE